MPSGVINAKFVSGANWENALGVITSGVARFSNNISGLETRIRLGDWFSETAGEVLIKNVQVRVNYRLVSGPQPTLNCKFELLPKTLSTTLTESSFTDFTFGSDDSESSIITWGGLFSTRDFFTNGGFQYLNLWLENSNTSVVEIDEVEVTIHYDQSTSNLLGARSLFIGRDDSFYDNVPLQSNGNTMDNLITSEKVNLIGDCIVNIERVLLEDTYFKVKSFDGKQGNQVMYVMTFTGNYNATTSNFPNCLSFDFLSYFQGGTRQTAYRSYGVTLPVTANLITSQLDKRYNLEFVSGIGWVNDGAIKPLIVSPKISYIRSSRQNQLSPVDYYFGATVRLANISGTMNTPRQHMGKIRPFKEFPVTPAFPASGTFTIKVTGIGVE